MPPGGDRFLGRGVIADFRPCCQPVGQLGWAGLSDTLATRARVAAQFFRFRSDVLIAVVLSSVAWRTSCCHHKLLLVASRKGALCALKGHSSRYGFESVVELLHQLPMLVITTFQDVVYLDKHESLIVRCRILSLWTFAGW